MLEAGLVIMTGSVSSSSSVWSVLNLLLTASPRPVESPFANLTPSGITLLSAEVSREGGRFDTGGGG